MKISRYAIILSSLLIISAGGCKKYTGEKAAADRARWVASLSDSIAVISKAKMEDSIRIENLRTELDSEIKNFSQVSNAREVEPYYILSSFRSAYPLTATGVVARVTHSLQFELVAALSGKRFDAVRFSSDGKSSTSTVIPPDQALNYTSADGLSICSFSGGGNDLLGKFIAENLTSPIKMDFLRNGSVQTSMTLSDSQKNLIADTWRLTSTRHILDSLESAQVINARKLEILHITRDKELKAAQSESSKKE